MASRSSPQVGFSAAMRRIKPIRSCETGGLPTGLDFQRQNFRKPARCQPIKVAGLTITKALRQSNKRASFENTRRSAAVVGWLSCHALERGPAVYARTDFGGQRCAAAEKRSAEADAVRNHNLAAIVSLERSPNTLSTPPSSHSYQTDFTASLNFLRNHIRGTRARLRLPAWFCFHAFAQIPDVNRRGPSV